MVAMSVKQYRTLSGLVVASLLCLGTPALAQVSSPIGTGGPSSSPPEPPHIQVNPRPVYRRCASWYVIQYRPSGQVLFPERHCWWQRW
jgi:hypothetical protein